MTSYLVVANRSLGSEALAERLSGLVAGHPAARFVVVAPVGSSPVLPAEVGGVMGGVAVLDVETREYLDRDANERLETLLRWCADRGVDAEGMTVVGDPLPTIERLVRQHDIDEVLVSTLPSRLSRWLRIDLVRRIARRVAVPVTTVEAAEGDYADGSENGIREEELVAIREDAATSGEAASRAEAGVTARRRSNVGESVYKIVELVGTSTESWEKAASSAVAMASRSLRDLRVAEIAELDLVIDDGAVTAYRAKIKVSFKYDAGD
jgi:flavin-binding protein dodecin